MEETQLKKIFVISLLAVILTTGGLSSSYDTSEKYNVPGEKADLFKFEATNLTDDPDIQNITLEQTGTAKVTNISSVGALLKDGDTDITFEETSIDNQKFNLTPQNPVGVEETKNISISVNISSSAEGDNETIILNVTDIYGGVGFEDGTYAEPPGNITLDTEAPQISNVEPEANKHYNREVSINASGNDTVSGIQTSEYFIENSDGDRLREGNLNTTIESSDFSYGNYTISYRFTDKAGFQNTKTREISLGTLSWDLTPNWAMEGEKINITKFRVNSNGTNSTVKNITVGYNGTAEISNITNILAKNETGKKWNKSDLNQDVFNISVNESINSYENITLSMRISDSADADNDTVDLNVSKIYGTNVTLPEPPVDPDGRTKLDTTKPDIGMINIPAEDANISGALVADAQASDEESGLIYKVWEIFDTETGLPVEFDGGGILQYNFGTSGNVFHLDSSRSYQVVYRVKDKAGHISSKKRDINIDNINPVLESSFIKDQSYHRETIPVNTTWSDDILGVETATFEILNTTKNPLEPNKTVANGDLNGTFDTTNHKFGQYIANYTLVDFAGNEIWETRNFYIDNMNPNFTHVNPNGLGDDFNLKGIYGSEGVQVEASSGDPPSNLSDSLESAYWVLENDSGVQRREESQTFFPNASRSGPVSEINTENYESGEYTIRMNVTDKAGNFNGTTKDIIIDTVAPNVSIKEPNVSYVDEKVLDVSATFEDDETGIFLASFDLRNSSDDIVASGSLNNTINASNFSSGFYNLNYIIRDQAGNQANLSKDSTTKSLTIDHLPPEVDSVRPEKNANRSRLIFLQGVYSDVHSGMNYTYYNLSNSTYSTNGSLRDAINTSNLSNGDYNVTIDFVDKLNNTKTINRNITVDKTQVKVWNFSINATPPVKDPDNPYVIEAEAYANDTITGVKECTLLFNSNNDLNSGYPLDYNRSTDRLNTTLNLDGEEGLYQPVILCLDHTDSLYNTGVSSGVNFSDGSNGTTFYFDDSAPRLENISPEGYLGNNNPTVKADIRDLSGVNESSINVWFNNSNISDYSLNEFNNSQNNSQYTLEFTPDNITEGEKYWVNVTAQDLNNLTASNESLAWNFTVDLTPPKAGNFSLPDYHDKESILANWTDKEELDSTIDYYELKIETFGGGEEEGGGTGTEIEEYDEESSTNVELASGKNNITVTYVDRAGNRNSTEESVIADLNPPRLESKTQRFTFNSLNNIQDKTVQFTIKDAIGTDVDSLNFTFSENPTEEYNPEQNYTDFNVSYTGNYSKTIKVNYTVSAEGNESYRMRAEVSDRFRSDSFEWVIGTLLTSGGDDNDGEDSNPSGPGSGGGGGGGAPVGGGSDSDNNFTFENSTLDEFDPSNRLELIEVDIPSLYLGYNSSGVYNLELENSGDSTISFNLEVISSYIETDIRDSITLTPGESQEIAMDVNTGETLPGNYSAGLLLDAEDVSVKKTFSYRINEPENNEAKRDIEETIEELESRYNELKEENEDSEQLREVSQSINSSKEAISENDLDRASEQLQQAEENIKEIEESEESSDTPWTLVLLTVFLLSLAGLGIYLYYNYSIDLSKIRSEL